MVTVVSITFVLFINFFSAIRALFRRQVFEELNATLNHDHHLLKFLDSYSVPLLYYNRFIMSIMFYNISKKGEIGARIVYINGEVIDR